MTQPERTAAEVYAEKQQDVAALIDWIQSELDTHRERSSADVDWGAVGDVTEVRRKLVETLTFLSGVGEKEIERNLAELRM